MTDYKMERYKVKKTIKDLVKNINETTHIPIVTEDDIFELFQLDSIADLRKVSRNFLKLSKILDYFSTVTEIATSEKEGIVKFGVESGNVINAETWKQAIGQTLGGYVSKVENKEAGKWYINDLTDGKIYKCIQSHRSTSFDITKFIDITNIGLSDKLENLFETHWINLGNNTPIGKVFETTIKVPTKPYKLFYSVFTGGSKFIDLKVAAQYATSEIVVNLGVSNTGFLQYSIAKNTSVIDGRHICVMFVF